MQRLTAAALRLGTIITLNEHKVISFKQFDHDIVFRFDESLEGWAPAASSEMLMGVQVRGGNLVGVVDDDSVSEPHLDSPPIALDSAGRQTIVIRMKYQGGSMRGARLAARYGAQSMSPDNSADHGRADWRARQPPAPITLNNIRSESPINDDDARTVWKGFVGGSATFAFGAADEGARRLDKRMAHAVTDIEIRSVAGAGPSWLDLQIRLTDAAGSWRTVFSTAIFNISDIQCFSTLLSPEEQHSVWRVVFPKSYGADVRIRELRLLPAIIEARFGISSGPDYHSYVIPIWQQAAVAKIGGDEPSSYESPLLLTRLRLYLGDIVLAPSEKRNHEMTAGPACEHWRTNEKTSFDQTSWAAAFWRLRTDHERVGPWVVSELVMYEDSACSATASLIQYIDHDLANSARGAIASAWSGAARGGVLHDGECSSRQVRETGGEHPFVSGAVITADHGVGEAWLGYAFERPVTVRCIAVCQTEDIATRAESVTLEWSDDGEMWTPHATLALPAVANIVHANPCELKHETMDLNRKRREAFDRSSRAFRRHEKFGMRTIRDAFLIDYIAIAYPPLVRSVTGCINKFWPYQEARLGAAPLLDDNIAVLETEHAHLEFGYAQVGRSRGNNGTASKEVVYANTFACPVGGGRRLTLRGERLGSLQKPTVVLIDRRPCLHITYHVSATSSVSPRHANSDAISCQLPPGTPAVDGEPVAVTIARGDVPELRDTVRYLAYQGPPSRMATPKVSNIAARSIDLTWEPPPRGRPHFGANSKLLGALQSTGYLITCQLDYVHTEAKGESLGSSPRYDQRSTHQITLGNVTKTTIVGLRPDTSYVFSVAAVVENRFNDQSFIDTVDLYGRRPHLPSAFVGPASYYTNTTTTLTHDLQFDTFTANATVNVREIVGPPGLIDGEENHGLILVGSANLENCNASHACCDGFDIQKYEATGDGCAAMGYACAETTTQSAYKARNEKGLHNAAVNNPVNFQRNHIKKRIARMDTFSTHAFDAFKPTANCGPAVRLTSSFPQRTGALWYARRLNVREGFESTMLLRTSNPSQDCGLMDNVFVSCESRGGDGFAFVIQEDRHDVLGREGAGLAHEGVNNSLAVELDTYYNPELVEPYENHVAIHSHGWRHTNSAHHRTAFGSSVRIPNQATVSSGKEPRVLRILYDPVFDPNLLQRDAFSVTSHTASFFTGGDFEHGLGTLSVFVDDLSMPVVITPLDLDSLLRLHHGRAWVGITSSTGRQVWQTHDILAWNFTALRKDPSSVRPPVVEDGYSAPQCRSSAACERH